MSAMDAAQEKIAARLTGKATIRDRRSRDGLLPYLRGVRSEFRKVVWPSKRTALLTAVTVLVAGSLFTGVVAGVDVVAKVFADVLYAR